MELTRRNSFPCSDGENGNGCPDEVHECGGIRSVKYGICSQEKAAANVQELKCRGVSFPFPGGDHGIRHEQSCRSHPSNRIKPQLIVHDSSLLSRLHHLSHFFGSFCSSVSTGSNRSPCFFARDSA